MTESIDHASGSSTELSTDPPSSSQIYDRYGFFGGKEYTDPNRQVQLPIKVIRARELKWREMCSNWEYWIKYRREKVRARCRKGIPDSMRSEAWQRLADSPMVLVARTKAITIPNETSQRSSTQRSLFSTLSRSITHRSMPNVITTSPSFRIKPGRNESVRRTLLKKLSKQTMFNADLSLTPQSGASMPETPATPPVCSRSSNLSPMSPVSIGKSPFLCPSTNQTRWSQVEVPTERSAAAGVYDVQHPIGNSYHSLSLSHQVNGYDVISPIREDDATFTTCVSVYGVPHSSVLNSTHPIDVGPNSSGGYASLSTNSCMTDNTSIHHHHIPSRTDPPSGTSSNDSYPSSSINSSSINSSVASNLWPLANSETAVDEHCSMEDARDTLVPLANPVSVYEDYCTRDGDQATCDQIRRDIDRQFPFHEIFTQKGGSGQESLFTLLKAYTIRHPEKGYCQGQAPIAAVLLMFMPEPDAFWTFNEVCMRYLEAYYDDGLERIQIDGEILYAFLKSIYPSVHKHLRKYDIQPISIVLEWFMCVFTRTLPWPAVLRVLDMFFCEGKVVIFRVALVLLYRMFGKRSQRKQHSEMDDIFLQLRDVHLVVCEVEQFISDVIDVPINPSHVAEQARRQSLIWEQKKANKPAVV